MLIEVRDLSQENLSTDALDALKAMIGYGWNVEIALPMVRAAEDLAPPTEERFGAILQIAERIGAAVLEIDDGTEIDENLLAG